MPATSNNAHARVLSRDLTSSFKSDAYSVRKKDVDNRILEAAIAQLVGRPGFTPAAISIAFGMK